MIHKLFILVILSLSALLHTPAAMAADFLKPDDAFIFNSQQDEHGLLIEWTIAHGYYLYQSRIKAFAGSDELPLTFTSQSQLKQDKNFGEMAVFFDKASVMISKSQLSDMSAAQEITIEYQGCSKQGLCYPPQSKNISLTPLIAEPAIATQTPVSSKQSKALNDTDGIAHFLKQANFITIIGVFFLLGIGLSVTPCILPMIPILSGIIVGQGKTLTTGKGLLLSSAYVVGMAMAYAVAGILAASFGAKGNLQLYMQHPLILGTFSLVFVALAMSMFGFYTLALPNKIQNALNNLSQKQKGGQISGVFIMGALSALVVSPCVSAPLAGALVFISSTGDNVMGGLALFVLGLGLGLPLLAIGAGGGKLVPKAGAWMEEVKVLFGIILLGIAIWLISRILTGPVSLILWSLLLVFYAVHVGAMEPAQKGFSRFKKAGSFTLLLYGCLLFIGGLMGNSDPLKPLALRSYAAEQNGGAHAEQVMFCKIYSEQELELAMQQALQNQKPVMLDFYADWCTSCLDMEKNVFHQPSVQTALTNYTLLQIDVTKNNEQSQNLLDKFGIFGPPSVLFFNPQGQELSNKRLQGELNAAAFIAHVASINTNRIK